MTQDEIIIRKGIVHILDAELGYPVFSEELLEMTPEISEFLREHIYRIMSGDELKKCTFDEMDAEKASEAQAFAEDAVEDTEKESGENVIMEQYDSINIYQLVKEFDEEKMIDSSKQFAQALYQIMNANIEIPSADFVVVTFQVESVKYLAFLKLNYKKSFVHMTQTQERGNVNQIICYKSMLPTASAKLSEAVLINLSDLSVKIIEKRYDINGKKMNYLSQLYLHCHAAMSSKAKMDIVTKAVQQVNKKHFEEEPVRQMEAKRILKEEIENNGSVNVERISEKIYGQTPEIKQEFDTKMEKYHMEKAEVVPKSEKTTKKLEKQYLKTDTGIEINIPMEQYQDADQVEFITNTDGTISVLIKNISKITTR